MLSSGVHRHLTQQLREHLRTDSTFWRRALHFGVHHGPEPWVRYSPPFFGLAFGLALRKQREVVRRTIRQLVGPRPWHQEMRDVAEVFTNFASSMTDAMLVGSGRGYTNKIHVEGEQYLLSSLTEGCGAIVATAQTAGWDSSGPGVSHRQKMDVLVVMEGEPNRDARRVHDAVRERSGVRVIHVGTDPFSSLPLLRHLRHRGGIVAMKFDRAAAGMRTRTVRFLGKPWQIPEGPLSLAALTGAPLIPVFTRRLGFLEYHLTNTPPIHLPRRPSPDQLDAAAQLLADRLEHFARQHPTQWFRFSAG